MRASPTGREILGSLAEYLVERWEHLAAQRWQVLHHQEPEAIHDLRVSSRRLRAVLDHLEPFHEGKQAARIKEPVRRLTRRLGTIRNLDEALQYFSADDFAALESFRGRLHQLREGEMLKLRHWLSKLEVDRLGRHITATAHSLTAGKDIGSRQPLAVLAERSLRLYLPIYEMLPRVAVPEHGAERHALRIAIKKWRYFNELLGRVTGSDTVGLLEQLRRYQAVLGRLNDLTVFEELLSAESPGSGVPAIVGEQLARQRTALNTEFLELLEQYPLQYLLAI